MFNRESILPSGSPLAIIILLLLAGGAAMLGLLINLSSFDSRYFVALLLAMAAALIVLMPTDRVVRFGFVLMIVSFGFGWRTIHLTSILDVHPTEVLVWLLFLALLIRGLARHSAIRFNIPFLAGAFLVLVIMGLVPAYLRRSAVDTGLGEFKIYLALVPTFYVVQWMIASRTEWIRAARWCALIGAYISLLGAIDYFVPSLSLAISGNQQLDTPIFGADDTFQRVGFLFYGSYLGAFVIFMFFAFGIGWFIDSWEEGDRRMLALTGLSLALMLAGMYLSGYRGLWYSVLSFGVLLMFLFRRARVLIAFSLVALPLLPSTFYLRFESVFLQQYADTSFYNRLRRAQGALDQIQNYPLAGTGFGGTGYVHSDLLQIASTLGLPSLFVFLLLMAVTIWRLFALVTRQGWVGRYAGLLFAYLCAQMVIFAGEGLIVWVQVMIPFWFVWAMAVKFIELAKEDASAPVPDAAALTLPAPALRSESRI